jgi:hypothetical protein
MSTDRPNNADSRDCADDPSRTILRESLFWIDCADYLPDDDRTVLMFRPSSDSEPVWPGYRSAGEWIAIDGSVMDSLFWPTHWAYMPEGPQT